MQQEHRVIDILNYNSPSASIIRSPELLIP